MWIKSKFSSPRTKTKTEKVVVEPTHLKQQAACQNGNLPPIFRVKHKKKLKFHHLEFHLTLGKCSTVFWREAFHHLETSKPKRICYFTGSRKQPVENGWKMVISWWFPTICYAKIWKHPIDSQQFINGCLKMLGKWLFIKHGIMFGVPSSYPFFWSFESTTYSVSTKLFWPNHFQLFGSCTTFLQRQINPWNRTKK